MKHCWFGETTKISSCGGLAKPDVDHLAWEAIIPHGQNRFIALLALTARCRAAPNGPPGRTLLHRGTLPSCPNSQPLARPAPQSPPNSTAPPQKSSQPLRSARACVAPEL